MLHISYFMLRKRLICFDPTVNLRSNCDKYWTQNISLKSELSWDRNSRFLIIKNLNCLLTDQQRWKIFSPKYFDVFSVNRFSHFVATDAYLFLCKVNNELFTVESILSKQLSEELSSKAATLKKALSLKNIEIFLPFEDASESFADWKRSLDKQR